ncbi:hypothetical protein COHA_003613 [Chlorella ohadii]|uniref:PARP-type domain-containing protein n=1 Tax=Chlorella ohadii TaxID=2649997 RepID=A0AAD5DS26_9CHLO|nr:hypothetical protein COHA_003613 [Chlorella ohadii]
MRAGGGTVVVAAPRGADTSYCIEYAKSGRSSCTECSKATANKSLRLGVGYEYKGSPSYKWQHWTCVTDGTIAKIGSPDKLKGLDALQRKDQELVRQRFGGVGKAPRKTGVHTHFG